MKFSWSSGLFVLVVLLAFGSCKKYPEGGRVKKAEKNLHGGLNDEYMKQWEVVRYEVDGADSTKTRKEGKRHDRFSYYHVQISKSGDNLGIETEVSEYEGTLMEKNRVLRITTDETLEGINCYRTNICERNILMPVAGSTACDWRIQQLDENYLKLTLREGHDYIIEMEYADQE